MQSTMKFKIDTGVAYPCKEECASRNTKLNLPGPLTLRRGTVVSNLIESDCIGCSQLLDVRILFERLQGAILLSMQLLRFLGLISYGSTRR